MKTKPKVNSDIAQLQLDTFATIFRPETGTGCFAEGTPILLESGIEKPIEEIVPVSTSNLNNCDVFLSVEGKRAFAIAVVSGIRKEPHVCVTAKTIVPRQSRKGDLKVTVSVNHTFVTTSNKVVQAQYLTEGTRVRTRYGDAVVDSAEYISNQGMVWNVFLASGEFVETVLPKIENGDHQFTMFLLNSSLGLSARNHFLFGSGFLTGDLHIQLRASELATVGIDVVRFG